MRKDCTLSALFLLALVGCADPGGPRLEPVNTGLNRLASAENAATQTPAGLPDPMSATEPTDPWLQAAVNLQELLELDGRPSDPPTDAAPAIEPADTSLEALATQSSEIEPPPDSSSGDPNADIEVASEDADASADDATEIVGPPVPNDLSERADVLATNAPSPDEIARQMLQVMLERAAPGDPSETARAVFLAAALDLPDDELDALDLHPSERARIDAARAFARSLTSQSVTNDQILKQLETLSNDLAASSDAFRVREARLCSEVRAFGDYSPIDDATLLVGVPNRLIVYTEPDRFASRETTLDGRTLFEVELSQGLTLYHDAPGELQVWHQPRARIVETSRRQRRDFYLVNEIELPARLSVGSYLLKVTTRDEVSGAIAERTLPIRIVADPTLVHVGG